MMRKYLRAMAFAAAFISVFGLSCCSPPRSAPPIAGIEAHSEMLALWLEGALKNATLVHVDAHGDLDEIAAEKLAAIEALVGRGDLDSLRRADSLGEEGLYDEGNFLTAALRLGVVRDVVWVVPGRDADSARALSRRFEEGRHTSLPTICTLETMPVLPGPVVLGIDVDFLPEFARERGISELEAARRMVRTLGRMAPRRLHVAVSYSTGDGYTPILLRWLGDAVLEMLRAFPSVPPPESERYWAFLMRAEGLRRAGEYDTLVDLLGACPTPTLDGAAGLLYLADALYLQDDIQRSFGICHEACRLDKHAAGIFLWVGKGLAIEGRVDEAARFVEAGHNADPAARDWKAEAYLALALRKAGRDAEAVSVLERLAAAYGSYSAEFLIGWILLDGGDRLQAGRHFERAFSRLEFRSELEVDLPAVREAVVSAARYYESIGQMEKAGRMKGDARFRAWF